MRDGMVKPNAKANEVEAERQGAKMEEDPVLLEALNKADAAAAEAAHMTARSKARSHGVAVAAAAWSAWSRLMCRGCAR